MTPPARPRPAQGPHEGHDPSLVAAYAAGDASGPALAEAAALVAGCPDCAALHRDLRAIAAALPALPPPVRRRDFRITAERAAALRPPGARGALARLLAPLAGARFAFAAPAGAGLAALGLAGLLLSGGLGQALNPAERAGSPAGAYPAFSAASPATGSLAPAVAPNPTGTSRSLDKSTGGVTVVPQAASAVPSPAGSGVEAGTTSNSGSGATPVGVATAAPTAGTTYNAIGTAAPSVLGGVVPATSATPQATAEPASLPGNAPADDGRSPVTEPAALLLGAGVLLIALRLTARRAAGS